MRCYMSFWLAVALFIPLVWSSPVSDRRFSISEPRTTLHTDRFWLPESPPLLRDSIKGAVSEIFVGRWMEAIGRWFRCLQIWEDTEPESPRDKASHLRTFEDATFISVRALPPRLAQAPEGGRHMYRRSEGFEEEEIPYQIMSGDRTVHDILGLVDAEMSSRTVEVTVTR